MKCPECESDMISSRESVPYDACGLPGVMLAGVEVRRCPACGEHEIVIPRIEDLHRAIASSVIDKPARLAPEEVRFLRKFLGLSGADFAKRMGVDPATVSRWEQPHTDRPIGAQADRLLRLLVALTPPKSDDDVEQLDRVGDSAEPVILKLEPTRSGWRRAAA